MIDNDRRVPGVGRLETIRILVDWAAPVRSGYDYQYYALLTLCDQLNELDECTMQPFIDKLQLT